MAKAEADKSGMVPIMLNGGYASDADIWNPPENGVSLTYKGFSPSQGGMKTIDGCILLGTMPDGNPSQGFYYWQDAGSEGVINRHIIISITRSHIYAALFSASPAWTDITSGMTMSTEGYYTFDVLNGILVFCDAAQTNGPFQLTGYNALAGLLLGSPPPGFIRVVNNFCFSACNATAPTGYSAVSWSNVSDPQTWGAANFIFVRKSDGDIITGLSALNSNLVIYKLNSISLLSTVTQIISGAVTLAPLTQITDRYGCVGPLAHDVMPDGTLVFLSSDGHLYNTDGTTFVDLSHNPWPASNIAKNLNTGNGADFAPLYNVAVKVDPSNKRIIVLVGVNAAPSLFYVYDWVRKAWSDFSPLQGSSYYLIYPQLLPSLASLSNYAGGYGPADKQLYMSDNVDHIFQISPAITNTKVDGTDLTLTYENSFRLSGGSIPGFIPRSVIIPLTLPASPSGTMTVTIGWDGVYQGSAASTLTLSVPGVTYYRLKVPINYTPGSGEFPITMQVKIILTGSSGLPQVTISPYYLSDQVLT